MRRRTISVFTCLVLLWPCILWAAWSQDLKENTVIYSDPVAGIYQYGVQGVSDGSGGAIVSWVSIENDRNIYAQRIDANGNLLWPIAGVPICTASGDQFSERVVPDGSGGAIIAWRDTRNDSKGNIYAQRVDANGNILWTTDGVVVCDVLGEQYIPEMASDGSGGVILTWVDGRVFLENNLFAQRIDGNGNALWTANGVALTTNAKVAFFRWPQIASDGVGGCLITWENSPVGGGGYGEIQVQRVDASGNPLWAGGGIILSPVEYRPQNSVIASDGLGGAIVAWTDSRLGSGYFVIYAQRVDASGNPLWGTYGITVSSETIDTFWWPEIISDGSGGAIMVWEKRFPDPDIHAQRVDPNGNLLWKPEVPICSAPNEQLGYHLISDGFGGAIVTWEDNRNGILHSEFKSDIYAQRVAACGNLLWETNGVGISAADGNQVSPSLVSDGLGGAIIAWEDGRYGVSSGALPDIFGQQVNAFGRLGTLTQSSSLIIPWYNDLGGEALTASFITVNNPSPETVTVAVKYSGTHSQGATPGSNSFLIRPNSTAAGRPKQINGPGEASESSCFSLPNTTGEGAWGSATFTGVMPLGYKLQGECLRMGTITLEGNPFLFSGISSAISQ